VVGLLYADDDLVLARGYGLVQALHPLTGESLWRLELGGEYWPIEAFRSSAGVHLLLDRPTDGDVEPPEVLTVDPMDGSELWTTVLDGVDHPDLDLQPEGSALYDDQLLVKSTGALHALDADSGEVNWHLRFGAIPESYGRAPLLIADNLVVVPDPNGELAVVDLADGQDVWRRSVAEGKVAAVGILGDLLIYTDGQGIHGAAISTGEMRWSEPTSRASASLIEDLLVVVGQGSVKALEPSSGALIWQIDTEFDLALAAMAIHPDLIAVVAEEGIVAVTLSTGRVEWSIGTEEQPSQLIGGPIAEAPLIEDGVLIVAFSDGRVAAYVGDTG
jgi:outer membrane protein assembly factor BamB